jgi:hypothetical protein
MRKVNKTIVLPIYYSLYHDQELHVITTLLQKKKVLMLIYWLVITSCKQCSKHLLIYREKKPIHSVHFSRFVRILNRFIHCNYCTIGHGQGFVKCSCKTGCARKTCKCVRSNVLCDPRCHKSNLCKNY